MKMSAKWGPVSRWRSSRFFLTQSLAEQEKLERTTADETNLQLREMMDRETIESDETVGRT
jgi:hypothetical protein